MAGRLPTRREVLGDALGGALAGGLLLAPSRRSRAASLPQIRMITNRAAQAEHGGFYQAKARGLYGQAGVDVAIDIGGSQVKAVQRLLAGRCDVVLSQTGLVLKGIQSGLPLVAIATTFQKGLGGLMVHPGISSLSQLKGHPILITEEGRSGFWLWLQKKYGFAASQAGTYPRDFQPFLSNPKAAMQGFATSEPYVATRRNIPFRFLLFSDFGLNGPANLLVTTHSVLQKKHAALAAFLKASSDGWKDFLDADPSPAQAAIVAANPGMSADQIHWSIAALKGMQALGVPGGAIGRMDDAGWQEARQIAVSTGLVAKSVDWRSGYTLEFNSAMTATV